MLRLAHLEACGLDNSFCDHVQGHRSLYLVHHTVRAHTHTHDRQRQRQTDRHTSDFLICTLARIHTQPMPLIPRVRLRKQGEESERTRRAIQRGKMIMKYVGACGTCRLKPRA